MGGGPALPIRLRSADCKSNMLQASEKFEHSTPKPETKTFQNHWNQDDKTSLEQRKAEHSAVLEPPQPCIRTFYRQERAEIQKHKIRGHVFAQVVDRYLAGEEVADIVKSMPEQPLWVPTYEEQMGMEQAELLACMKLPLPDYEDED